MQINLVALRNIDIRTVGRDSLVDLKDVPIDTNLPRHKRMEKFIQQIGNPYLYKCGGIVIKESFSNSGKSMEDCLEQYIGTLI